jgi:hypothetical protein
MHLDVRWSDNVSRNWAATRERPFQIRPTSTLRFTPWSGPVRVFSQKACDLSQPLPQGWASQIRSRVEVAVQLREYLVPEGRIIGMMQKKLIDF